MTLAIYLTFSPFPLYSSSWSAKWKGCYVTAAHALTIAKGTDRMEMCKCMGMIINGCVAFEMLDLFAPSPYSLFDSTRVRGYASFLPLLLASDLFCFMELMGFDFRSPGTLIECRVMRIAARSVRCLPPERLAAQSFAGCKQVYGYSYVNAAWMKLIKYNRLEYLTLNIIVKVDWRIFLCCLLNVLISVFNQVRIDFELILFIIELSPFVILILNPIL